MVRGRSQPLASMVRVLTVSVVVILVTSGCAFWFSVPYPPYLQHLTSEINLSELIPSTVIRVDLVAVPISNQAGTSGPVSRDRFVIRGWNSQNQVVQGIWVTQNLEVLAALGGADLQVDGIPVTLDGQVFRTNIDLGEDVGGGIQMGEVLLQDSGTSLLLTARGMGTVSGPVLPRQGVDRYVVFTTDSAGVPGVQFAEFDEFLEPVIGSVPVTWQWFPDLTPGGQSPPMNIRTRTGVGLDQAGDLLFWVLLQFDYWFDPPDPPTLPPPPHVVFRTFPLSEVEGLFADPPGAGDSVFTWAEFEDLASRNLGHHIPKSQESVAANQPIYVTPDALIVRVAGEVNSRGDYRKNDHYISIDLLTGNKSGELWLHQEGERAREITGVPDPAGSQMWLFDGIMNRLLQMERWW